MVTAIVFKAFGIRNTCQGDELDYLGPYPNHKPGHPARMAGSDGDEAAGAVSDVGMRLGATHTSSSTKEHCMSVVFKTTEKSGMKLTDEG